MLAYVARRLLAALPLLWLVWTLTFLAARLAPGGPLELYDSPEASRTSVEHLTRVYGLSDPLPVQYFRQLTATLRGDFALSTSQGRPVVDIVREAVCPTLLLASLALSVQFIVGLAVGLLAAARPHGHLDHVLSGGALLLHSIPSFWIAIQATALFAHGLGWFPSSHMRSATPPEGIAGVWDLVRHLVLPVTALSAGGIAVVARHARARLIEALGAPFSRAAASRGLPRGRILVRHALKPSLLPVLALAGLALPLLLSGAVVIEVIFSWPGLGQVAYNGILARDFPIVQATTLMAAALVVLGGLISDLAVAAVDPRIRLRHGSSAT